MGSSIHCIGHTQPATARMRQPTSEGESMAVSQGIDTVILCTMCLLRHWAVVWEDLLGREVWCGVVGVVQLWWLDRLETAAVTGTSGVCMHVVNTPDSPLLRHGHNLAKLTYRWIQNTMHLVPAGAAAAPKHACMGW